MKKEELKSLIMEKTNGKLTETDVDKMVESLSEEQLEYLRVEVTSDPYEFEDKTRMRHESDRWEDKNIVQTNVLIGDYQPGIDDIYYHSDNDSSSMPEESHEMSDFSINETQIAIVSKDNTAYYNGNNTEGYSNELHIYIPEEKEYGENVSFKQIVLNSRRDKLFNDIKEKVGDRLDDEQINLIISQFNFETSSLPKIEVTSNPYEFEKETRRCYESDRWEDKDIVQTNVLIGDYQPGIDDIYYHSDNGNSSMPEKSHEMSDFSINQTQIAIASKEYIEEYSDEIHIYIPEEKEYGENVSFKQIVLNSRRDKLFNDIKEKVGDRLSNEQITLIISQFNLEDSSLPKIGVTSNPYEFEKKTRRNSNVFEHSWAGSKENIVETNVLIGDYQPGIDDIYEYSQNGDSRTPEESHEMSDFSINQTQIAIASKEYIDHYNGNDIEEYSDEIHIYIPEEKEYGENVSFKQIVLNKRREQLFNAIKEKVGDRLSDEQITLIISQFNLEDSSLPKIGVTSNPYEFEKKTRRNSNVFEHSWAGTKKNIVETNVLIGDYQPGIDDIYEYSQNGDSRTPEESHEMSDFTLNNLQAATVFSNYDDQYNGAHRTEHEESIQIYLPDEKLLETEFKGTTSFGQLRALIMEKAEEASLEGIKGEMETIKAINNDKTVEQNQQIEQ